MDKDTKILLTLPFIYLFLFTTFCLLMKYIKNPFLIIGLGIIYLIIICLIIPLMEKL